MLRRILQSIYKTTSTASSTHQPQQKEVIAVPIEQLIDDGIIRQIISDTSIEIVPILIDSYLEESAGRMDVIDKALASKDYQTLEFEAHTLAGTSLAIGVSALGQLAKTIEQQCLAKEYDNALKNAALLKELATQSQQALQSFKEQL